MDNTASSERAVLFSAFVVLVLLFLGIWAYVLFRDAGGDEPREQEQGMEQQDMTPQLGVNDAVIGTGATAQQGDTVSVHYVGTLPDGTKFDSSRDRGEPFVFTIGAGGVIQGWELGLIGMQVGGVRNLVVPPELGYGSRAYGPIPANATLHFEIELLGIEGR